MELNDNPVQFSLYVETRASQEDTTCMDIICDFCKEHDLDFSEITKYITENLKQKIRVEAETARLYKKTNTVTF